MSFMNIKEKSLTIRLLIFIVGFVVLVTISAAIEVALKQFAGITIGGAIPKTILYMGPVILLGYWVGIWGGKKEVSTEVVERPPSDDKWTN